MYRLWLHGLHGPCCLLSPERPLNLITHLTPGFNGLGKGNCKTRWETLKFWYFVSYIRGLMVFAILYPLRPCYWKWVLHVSISVGFAVQGWGLLSKFSMFRYFPNFSVCSKRWLTVWYHTHIWQVSPQLSCRDTWQIWTWLEVSNL